MSERRVAGLGAWTAIGVALGVALGVAAEDPAECR
jgi:hypothetical protein